MSKYGVFSSPYFPSFGLNTERYGVSLRIQSECRKIRTRKNSVFELFFHAVAPTHKSPTAPPHQSNNWFLQTSIKNADQADKKVDQYSYGGVKVFILFYFIFILFYYFILFYFILFYFILLLFYFIFILFYFIVFILFYFTFFITYLIFLTSSVFLHGNILLSFIILYIYWPFYSFQVAILLKKK